MIKTKDNKPLILPLKNEGDEHKIAVLDFDDFSLSAPNFDRLLKLKEYFPNFKVTLFFYPYDETMFAGIASIDKYVEWTQMVKKHLDWIEIAAHGFGHQVTEFQDRKMTEKTLLAFDKMTTEIVYKKSQAWLPWKKKEKISIGLPYAKIVKGPKWQVGEEAYEYFKENDWLVAVDRNQARPNIKDLRTYVYNWSIEEEPPLEYKIIKGHGHLTNTTPNSLSWEHCFLNILKLPADIEFLFISEYDKRYNKVRAN